MRHANKSACPGFVYKMKSAYYGHASLTHAAKYIFHAVMGIRIKLVGKGAKKCLCLSKRIRLIAHWCKNQVKRS